MVERTGWLSRNFTMKKRHWIDHSCTNLSVRISHSQIEMTFQTHQPVHMLDVLVVPDQTCEPPTNCRRDTPDHLRNRGCTWLNVFQISLQCVQHRIRLIVVRLLGSNSGDIMSPFLGLVALIVQLNWDGGHLRDTCGNSTHISRPLDECGLQSSHDQLHQTVLSKPSRKKPLKLPHSQSHLCGTAVSETARMAPSLEHRLRRTGVGCLSDSDSSETIHRIPPLHENRLSHIWLLNVDGGCVHTRNWAATSAIVVTNLATSTALPEDTASSISCCLHFNHSPASSTVLGTESSRNRGFFVG